MAIEIEAARNLLTSIRALVGEGDEQTVADTFEGETKLDVVIRDAVIANLEDEARAAGLKSLIDNLTERKKRFEKRIEGREGLIEQAMIIAGWQRQELDVATLSLSKRQPSIEIDDESVIPTNFWKRPDPVLDRAGLKATLNECEKRRAEIAKVADPAERASQLQGFILALPPHPDRNEALAKARAINAHEERCAALEAILNRFPPIPGCHLTPPGQGLTIRRK
jgi:hypothetical protein